MYQLHQAAGEEDMADTANMGLESDLIPVSESPLSIQEQILLPRLRSLLGGLPLSLSVCDAQN